MWCHSRWMCKEVVSLNHNQLHEETEIILVFSDIFYSLEIVLMAPSSFSVSPAEFGISCGWVGERSHICIILATHEYILNALVGVPGSDETSSLSYLPQWVVYHLPVSILKTIFRNKCWAKTHLILFTSPYFPCYSSSSSLLIIETSCRWVSFS